MTVPEIIVYSLVGAAGVTVAGLVWFRILQLLTRWKKPWLRILSVTVFAAIVTVFSVLIATRAAEERVARGSPAKIQLNQAKPSAAVSGIAADHQ